MFTSVPNLRPITSGAFCKVSRDIICKQKGEDVGQGGMRIMGGVELAELLGTEPAKGKDHQAHSLHGQ